MFTKLATILIAAAAFVGFGANANAVPAKCALMKDPSTVLVCNPDAPSKGFSANVPAPDKTVQVAEVVTVVDVPATLVTPAITHLEVHSHNITIGGQHTDNRSGK